MWTIPLAISIQFGLWYLIHHFNSKNGQSTITDDDPCVDTECGRVRGRVIRTARGDCDAYFGVPFAAPPIGELRWRKPAPCWFGHRDATKFPPLCIQFRINATSSDDESEDCLYLNIFVPKSADGTADLLPVMVFIHGGHFAFGSASDFSQDGTCENLATRGVVVVVIQYRLLLYGFFSTGDSAAPGNYAIWDQIEALKWIQRNIAYFNGDPSRVTIFGQSAGAASVSYLTYTPVAESLFQQVISQSGSALSKWAQLRDTLANTKQLAEAAGCQHDDSELMVECLRHLSTTELQTVFKSIRKWNVTTPGTPYFQFAARVDGELFDRAKLREIQTGKPTIIGVNSGEMSGVEKSCVHAPHAVLNFTLDIIFPRKSPKAETQKRLLRYAYIESQGNPNDANFVCRQVHKMQTNFAFHAPAAAEAISKAEAGNPVWVYNFSYYSEEAISPHFSVEQASPHGHELCYLFLITAKPICPAIYEGENRKIADFMGHMWANFASKGNPSPDEFEWPLFHVFSQSDTGITSTMTIDTALTIEPYLEMATFLLKLIKRMGEAYRDETVL